MRSFKGLIIVIIISLSINIANLAQTENKTESDNLNSFSVYFINGYALGYDYFKTEAFKLRAILDLGLSGSNNDSDGETKSLQFGTTNFGSRELIERETDTDAFNVSLTSQIIFPIYKTEYGNFYFGVGPSVGYSRDYNNSKYDSKYFNPDTVTTPNINYSSSENTYISYHISANALLGAEALVSKNISLFVETHLNGGMRWTDDKWFYKYQSNTNYEQHREDNQKGSGWFYSFQYAKIGVKISL